MPCPTRRWYRIGTRKVQQMVITYQQTRVTWCYSRSWELTRASHLIKTRPFFPSQIRTALSFRMIRPHRRADIGDSGTHNQALKFFSSRLKWWRLQMLRAWLRKAKFLPTIHTCRACAKWVNTTRPTRQIIRFSSIILAASFIIRKYYSIRQIRRQESS